MPTWRSKESTSAAKSSGSLSTLKKTKTRRRAVEHEENSCFVDKASRTIYVVGEITQKLSSKFRRYIRAIASTPPVTGDVTVEINSPGGDIEAGLMMIDTVNEIKARGVRVVTRATGQAASMGSMLLVSGSRREALPNSSIMIHEGTFWFRARSGEIDYEVAEARRLEEVCWGILDSATGKQPGYWKTMCHGHNLYLSPPEAKNLGVIDAIVGESK